MSYLDAKSMATPLVRGTEPHTRHARLLQCSPQLDAAYYCWKFTRWREWLGTMSSKAWLTSVALKSPILMKSTFAFYFQDRRKKKVNRKDDLSIHDAFQQCLKEQSRVSFVRFY